MCMLYSFHAVVRWIVFLIILVLLLTIVVVIVVAALIYTIVLLRKQGIVNNLLNVELDGTGELTC